MIGADCSVGSPRSELLSILIRGVFPLVSSMEFVVDGSVVLKLPFVLCLGFCFVASLIDGSFSASPYEGGGEPSTRNGWCQSNVAGTASVTLPRRL